MHLISFLRKHAVYSKFSIFKMRLLKHFNIFIDFIFHPTSIASWDIFWRFKVLFSIELYISRVYVSRGNISITMDTRERERSLTFIRESRRGAVDDVFGGGKGRRRRQTHWQRCKRAKFRTQYAVSAPEPIFKLSRCGARASTSLPGMPDG